MSTFLYRFILHPLLFILVHFYGIFNPKIRKALRQRYSVLKHAGQIKKDDTKTIIIHTASMGEFEHIKPLIRALKKQFKVKIVVTFFSPSGFENVRAFEGVEKFLYLPFDFAWVFKKFYRILQPHLLIIAKHDAWTNQVLVARKLNIPVYLINASLSPASSRIHGAARWLLRPVYEAITTIYAISESDAEAFRQFYPKARIKAIGDTKFDQVLIRKERALKKELIPESWTENAFVLVLGSIWKEDAGQTLTAVKKLIKEYSHIRVIIVPHDPTREFVSTLKTEFRDFGVRLFSQAGNEITEPVIIVDRIGILADLYKYAHVAFVGGSFRQGIHNVMEAAVYGVPVLYGPVHQNASEAARLNKAGGGLVFHSADEFERLVKKFLSNEERRTETGRITRRFALDNVDATKKLIEEWKSLLF